MKRIIQIAVVTIFTLGQVFLYQHAYAGQPIPTPTYDTPTPEIAIDTNSEPQDPEVAPTESTDTTQFLAAMDLSPISRAAEEAAINFTATTRSKGDSPFYYNLQVSVDQDRNVTVTWVDEIRTSTLEPDSYQIVLEPLEPNSVSGVWIVSLAYRGGNLSLKSFETHTQTAVSERRHHYVFTEKGFLSFEYTQAHSTGKEADGLVYEIEEEGEVYYAYDNEDNLIVWVDVFDRTVNGLTNHTAYYRVNDWDRQIRIDVNALGMKESLLDDIDSALEYEIIDQFAHSKTVRRYSNGDLNTLNYDIEIQYVPDSLGVFAIPKRVRQEGKVFIVQGGPDAPTDESNDIFLADLQFFKGYHIYYGEAYERTTAPLFPHATFLGYGLVFEKFEELPDGRLEYKVKVVNYPENIVELDGVTYRIKIDEKGIISFSQTFPLPGDLNGDMKVDSQDLTAIFQAGKYETGVSATYEEGDVDGNGLVETFDLIILMQNYQREVLHRIPFGDGQLVIEKDPDRNGEIHTFARVFVPTSEQPLVEFEILTYNIHRFDGDQPIISIYARTTDGRDVEFLSYAVAGLVAPGLRDHYAVGGLTTSDLFGTRVVTATQYDLFKIGGAYVFKRTAFVAFGWEIPDGSLFIPYNLVGWEYDDSGELVRTVIRFEHPNINLAKGIAFIKEGTPRIEFALGPALGHIVGVPPENLVSENLVDLQTTEEASGLIRTVRARTVDGREIFIEITREGFEVEVRGTSAELEALF